MLNSEELVVRRRILTEACHQVVLTAKAMTANGQNAVALYDEANRLSKRLARIQFQIEELDLD